MSQLAENPNQDEPGVAPWEQPGATRLDCEPHRGPLLLFGGRVCFLLGVLSLCGGITALLAMPLGVAVRVAARRDLALMARGLMDSAGELPARKAEWAAERGMLAAFCLGILAGGWLLLAFLLTW